jgi:hypothetical protein
MKDVNQTEAARLAGVDRTTIRAWTQAGMPYVPPKGRGNEGMYRTSVVLYWGAWLAKKEKIGVEAKPLQALALARAFEIDTGTTSDIGEREYFELFPQMVRGFFAKAEIQDAMNFAAGFVRGWRARAN